MSFLLQGKVSQQAGAACTQGEKSCDVRKIQIHPRFRLLMAHGIVIFGYQRAGFVKSFWWCRLSFPFVSVSNFVVRFAALEQVKNVVYSSVCGVVVGRNFLQVIRAHIGEEGVKHSPTFAWGGRVLEVDDFSHGRQTSGSNFLRIVG